MGLALLPTSVIPLGGRIKGVVVRHGAHALPWDSLSRGRGLHSGAPVSLSLMAATGFTPPALARCRGTAVRWEFELAAAAAAAAVPAEPSFRW